MLPAMIQLLVDLATILFSEVLVTIVFMVAMATTISLVMAVVSFTMKRVTYHRLTVPILALMAETM